MYTFVSILTDDILQSVESDNRKWVNHGEQHPDIDHLDVGGCGEGLGHSDKAEIKRV